MPADPAFINQLATTYLQNSSSIKAVLQQIFTSRQFQDPAVYFTHYSWPAEYVVRSIKEAGWIGFSAGTTLTPLVNMGQQLLEPPNVAGWQLGQAWFSTGTMLARMNFASTLSSNQKFRLATAAAGSKQSAQALVNFMLARLTPADISTAAPDLLAYASSEPWTGSDAQMQTKSSGLAHLILGSTGYQVV